MTTCPGCEEKRLHTADEMAQFHPLAGHGYEQGQGWCCPEAEAAHHAEREEREKSDGTVRTEV
jgi:hypothetical protein